MTRTRPKRSDVDIKSSKRSLAVKPVKALKKLCEAIE